MEWNSSLYDQKHDFVAEYGKGLLEFIPANKKQAILDLGCGTGVLTAQLAALAGRVMGVDSSRNMIDTARTRFAQIEFQVCDALALPFEQEWDVVFSNAVFHWIHDHRTLLENVYKALRPDGLLVCEFGAHGNIAAIETAFAQSCAAAGYDYCPKFNFPTTGQFARLLTDSGFTIERIYDFDRPTVLKDGQHGLTNWMKQFFASELSAMPEKVQADVLRETGERTRARLWNGSEWVADYRRLRAVARR